MDITLILTDRTALDDNIRRDIVNYPHLKDVVRLADRADDLPRFLKQPKSIIDTTQPKFACEPPPNAPRCGFAPRCRTCRRA